MTAENKCPQCYRPIGACASFCPFKQTEMCGLTFLELVQACRNIGFDLTCGACAAVFFCGFGFPDDVHTCKDRPPGVDEAPIRHPGYPETNA